MVASAVDGKVAEVLNDREVVINRGEEHGVILGTRFKVVEMVDIQDPDTGDELGAMIREKIRLKVVHVQPTLCIARTYQTYRRKPSSRDGVDYFLRTSITEVQRISSDEPFAPSVRGAFIEIGDVVNEVTDDE